MTNRRLWVVSGGVVLAAVLFGLGVLLGVMIGDDDATDTTADDAGARSSGDDAAGSSESGDDTTRDRFGPDGARDARGLEGLVGPLLERFLDGLGERFSDEGRGREDDDRSRPGRFELLPGDLDLPDIEIPDDLAEFGACIGEGVADLLENGERPLLEAARDLWERCTS